jgi:hypothetical protein
LKNVFTLHIPPELHTHLDLVVLTSLTQPRTIFSLVVLQIGKAKDLSAPLRISMPTKTIFYIKFAIVCRF